MVVRIIVELNTGRPIMDFVKLYFAPQKKIASWERINDSFSLENDDFLVFYDELIEDVCNLRIYGMSNLGYSMAYLLSLDSHKTKEISDVDFNRLHDALPKYLEKIDTAEQLYNAHLEFERGLNSYLSNKTPERLPVIFSQYKEEYQKRLKQHKN